MCIHCASVWKRNTVMNLEPLRGDRCYGRRVNYALIVLLTVGCSLLRRPHALLAIADCTLAVLCLNDTFATSLR